MVESVDSYAGRQQSLSLRSRGALGSDSRQTRCQLATSAPINVLNNQLIPQLLVFRCTVLGTFII